MMRKPLVLSICALLAIVVFQTARAHLLDAEEQNIIRSGEYNVGEDNFPSFRNIEDPVRNNNHLHTPCTEPYPGN